MRTLPIGLFHLFPQPSHGKGANGYVGRKTCGARFESIGRKVGGSGFGFSE